MKRLATFLAVLALVSASFAQASTSYTATVGQKATFTASCAGTPPFTYQWYRAAAGAAASTAVAIPGATTSTYSIASLSLADAGTYYVKVSNPAGSASSDTAIFTVTPQPPSQVVITIAITVAVQ